MDQIRLNPVVKRLESGGFESKLAQSKLLS